DDGCCDGEREMASAPTRLESTRHEPIPRVRLGREASAARLRLYPEPGDRRLPGRSRECGHGRHIGHATPDPPSAATVATKPRPPERRFKGRDRSILCPGANRLRMSARRLD